MKRKISDQIWYLFRHNIDGLHVERRNSTYSKEIREAIDRVKQQAKTNLAACGYRVPLMLHVTIEGNYAVTYGTAKAIIPLRGASTVFRYEEP